MSGFAGFVELSDTIRVPLVVVTTLDVPVNADALPTFRVYSQTGPVPAAAGTCTFLHSGSITNATNASPIVVTSSGHGLTTGARVTITGVGGNTAANGTFVVTVLDGNTFSLDGSTGNGAYTSGGTWNVTGAYKASVDATEANGFAAGENYTLLVSWAVSASQRAGDFVFTVA